MFSSFYIGKNSCRSFLPLNPIAKRMLHPQQNFPYGIRQINRAVCWFDLPMLKRQGKPRYNGMESAFAWCKNGQGQLPIQPLHHCIYGLKSRSRCSVVVRSWPGKMR